MRVEFIETTDLEYAYSVCPWASKHAAVYGGYWMFESVYDYDVFLQQQ